MNEAKPARREMMLVNGREIPVAVIRSRRARRYVLSLRDDGLARLTIPRSGSAREAWEFAQRQRPWLERQLQYLASRPIRPKEWRLGTEILFRGEKVKIETVSHSHFAADHPANSAVQTSKPLADDSSSLRSSVPERALINSRFASEPTSTVPCLQLSAHNSPSCEGEGGRQTDLFKQLLPAPAPNNPQSVVAAVQTARNPQFEHAVQVGAELIPVADPTSDLCPAIERHLRTLAAKELPARTLEFAALHQLSVSRVTVRAQRTRWGSCSFKRVISLNWRLIQTPPFVRDYIILHELMHLRQMNHSPRFWKEVERVCPDYRKAKLWLKENPGLLDLNP